MSQLLVATLLKPGNKQVTQISICVTAFSLVIVFVIAALLIRNSKQSIAEKSEFMNRMLTDRMNLFQAFASVEDGKIVITVITSFATVNKLE